MGFLRCKKKRGSYSLDKLSSKMEIPNGWAIWTERQHYNGTYRDILTLFWNPQISRKAGIIMNGLDHEAPVVKKAEEYFIGVLEKFQKMLSAVVDADILREEEILGYLGSVLRSEPFSMHMLEEPLYLDAILSKDIDFQVFGTSTAQKNELCINERFVTALTPLGYPPMPIMGMLFHAFRDFDYRFVRRFLFTDEKNAEKEMAGYMEHWCRGRKSIKTFLQSHLDGVYYGIYTSAFVFQFPEEEREKNEVFIKRVLETMELPHILEDYNRKHVWWSTMPGIHQAGLTAPLKGIGGLPELLTITEDEDAAT